MEIRCVVLTEKQQRALLQNGWIPKELEIIPDEKRLFFGGIDERNNMRGIAVYRLPQKKRKKVVLEYVSVPKQCRRQGIATTLLRLAEKQLQQYERIVSARIGSKEELECASAFLQAIGFQPLIEPKYFLVYAQGQFQGSRLEQLKTVKKNFWDSVVRIDDYHDLRLKCFLTKPKADDFYIEERSYRPQLWRFFIEGGQIKGAAGMQFTPNGNLITRKGYLAPDLKNKYAMTLLIASLIYDLQDILQPDIKIYLKLYQSQYYKSVIELFGKGQEEYWFQEYGREIGGL